MLLFWRDWIPVSGSSATLTRCLEGNKIHASQSDFLDDEKEEDDSSNLEDSGGRAICNLGEHQEMQVTEDGQEGSGGSSDKASSGNTEELPDLKIPRRNLGSYVVQFRRRIGF